MSDEEFLPYQPPEQESHTEPIKSVGWSEVEDGVKNGCIGAFVVGGLGVVFGPIALLVLCVLAGDFGGAAGLVISLVLVAAAGGVFGAVIGSVIGLIVFSVKAERKHKNRSH